MPALVEMTISDQPSDFDDSLSTWEDDLSVWTRIGSVFRYAIGGTWQGENYIWKGYISSIDNISFVPDYKYGGFCRLNAGGFSLSMAAFQNDGRFPPPKIISVIIYYTGTTEAAKVKLFEGTGYRRKISPTEVNYDLFSPDFSDNFLYEVTDYDGNVVPVPRVVIGGTFTHAKPVRIADDGSSRPCYVICGGIGIPLITGLYDDGVDITSNIDDTDTDTTDGVYMTTIKVVNTAVPVGEVTCSGGFISSSNPDIAEVMSIFGLYAWDNILDPGYLMVGYPPGGNNSLDTVVYQQEKLMDFLSRAAAVTYNIFYYIDSIIYIWGLDSAYAPSEAFTYTSSEFLQDSEYEDDSPIALIKYNYETYTPADGRVDDESTTAKYIKTIENEVSEGSLYSYGSTEEVDVMSISDKAEALVRLQAILDTVHKTWFSVSLPMQSSLPLPGDSITVVDDRIQDRPITSSFRAREITYDFNSLKVSIKGEGTISQ